MILSDVLHNKHRYDMEFNNVTSKAQGLIFYDYPVFTYGRERITTVSINGKVGDAVIRNGGKQNAEIECVFLVESDNLQEKIRDIRRWLSGSGKLKFSDDADIFYEVIALDLSSVQRISRRYGKYTVRFIVFPYEFLEEGQVEHNIIHYNPYSECMPTYFIEGTGNCTMTVNGKEFFAHVNGSIIIDVRRMLAYTSDMMNANTFVVGDYEDLILPTGNVLISITDGFDLKIKPNWGYAL